MLTPGVQFPLYGYASAKTAKTDGKTLEKKSIHIRSYFTHIYLLVGLLAPKSSRTEKYIFFIDTGFSVRDYSYTWTVGDDTPTGKYEIGIGFFYHEVSPEIHVIE